MGKNASDSQNFKCRSSRIELKILTAAQSKVKSQIRWGPGYGSENQGKIFGVNLILRHVLVCFKY